MKQKHGFSNELAYLVGLIILALGTKQMEFADFGMSMVVAPPYVIFAKLSTALPWLTFGMTQTLFQVLLLFALCLVMRKPKVLPFLFLYTAIEVGSCILSVYVPSIPAALASPVTQTLLRVLLLAGLAFAAWRTKQTYLLAFVTSFFFGLLLDGIGALCGLLPEAFFANLIVRHFHYVFGVVISSAGVALLFRTYLTPEVFELFIIELAAGFGFKQSRLKTVYDISSTVLALALSFLLFGLWQFVGIGIGTAVCALVNGLLIGLFSKLYDRCFAFRDALPKLRAFFRGDAPASEP